MRNLASPRSAKSTEEEVVRKSDAWHCILKTDVTKKPRKMDSDRINGMEESFLALVADDDQLHREMFFDLMSEEGMTVHSAEDGEKAVALIEKNEYDIVLSDLMMPGKNGLEVLSAARNKSRDTLVILITGFGTLETAVEAIRLGAHDYITKPFKLEELQLVLKNGREKISLVRSNRKLVKDLEEAAGKIESLERERDTLRDQLEEVQSRLSGCEQNLSVLFQRFPFLLSPNTPITPVEKLKQRSKDEEENGKTP